MKIPWRRERLPTPVFWPGELHGLYSPWSLKELDRSEQFSLSKENNHKLVERGPFYIKAEAHVEVRENCI